MVRSASLHPVGAACAIACVVALSGCAPIEPKPPVGYVEVGVKWADEWPIYQERRTGCLFKVSGSYAVPVKNAKGEQFCPQSAATQPGAAPEAGERAEGVGANQ